jgi:MFS family permease
MAGEDRERSGLGAIGRALRHRNYRLFFFGQGTSLVGSWLSRVALSWLVFRLTGSAMLLGLVGFVGYLPSFLLSPMSGVLVDRWDRHRTLLVTQAAAMLQSALLAWFTLRGSIGTAHIITLSIAQGVINAFDTPARQAFLVEIVEERADLPNAIALTTTMVNLARVAGPALAALLVGLVGEGWCFAIDSVSYLAVLGSLVAMRLAARPLPRRDKHVLVELRDGLAYIARSRPIRSILLLLSLVSLTGVPYMVLMPIFAAEVYGGGPHTLGLLMAATGAGAIVAALWMAARRSVRGLVLVLCSATIVFGSSLIAFSMVRSLPLAIATLVIGGGGMMVQMLAANTLLQTIVEEDKRGRVMSFYAMSYFGIMPFGNLAAGWAGARIGAPYTVACGGVITLLGGLSFLFDLPALRRSIRPIYQHLGIVPTDPPG